MKELSNYLRKLADEIDRRGIDRDKLRVSMNRSVIEIDPVQDGNGELWKSYKPGRELSIGLRLEFLQDE